MVEGTLAAAAAQLTGLALEAHSELGILSDVVCPKHCIGAASWSQHLHAEFPNVPKSCRRAAGTRRPSLGAGVVAGDAVPASPAGAVVAAPAPLAAEVVPALPLTLAARRASRLKAEHGPTEKHCVDGEACRLPSGAGVGVGVTPAASVAPVSAALAPGAGVPEPAALVPAAATAAVVPADAASGPAASGWAGQAPMYLTCPLSANSPAQMSVSRRAQTMPDIAVSQCRRRARLCATQARSPATLHTCGCQWSARG